MYTGRGGTGAPRVVSDGLLGAHRHVVGVEHNPGVPVVLGLVVVPADQDGQLRLAVRVVPHVGVLVVGGDPDLGVAGVLVADLLAGIVGDPEDVAGLERAGGAYIRLPRAFEPFFGGEKVWIVIMTLPCLEPTSGGLRLYQPVCSPPVGAFGVPSGSSPQALDLALLLHGVDVHRGGGVRQRLVGGGAGVPGGGSGARRTGVLGRRRHGRLPPTGRFLGLAGLSIDPERFPPADVPPCVRVADTPTTISTTSTITPTAISAAGSQRLLVTFDICPPRSRPNPCGA